MRCSLLNKSQIYESQFWIQTRTSYWIYMWLGTFSVVVMGSAQWLQDYWFKFSGRPQRSLFTLVLQGCIAKSNHRPFESLLLNMCRGPPLLCIQWSKFTTSVSWYQDKDRVPAWLDFRQQVGRGTWQVDYLLTGLEQLKLNIPPPRCMGSWGSPSSSSTRFCFARLLNQRFYVISNAL